MTAIGEGRDAGSVGHVIGVRLIRRSIGLARRKSENKFATQVGNRACVRNRRRTE